MVSKANYYQRQAAREAKAAKQAVTEAARNRHSELAARFEQLASQSQSPSVAGPAQ